MNKLIKLAFLGAAAVGLVSCQDLGNSGGSPTSGYGSSDYKKYVAYDVPTKLPKNPSNVRVKVSLSKQIVYVMEGNTPLMVMPVSIGKSSSPTPRGNFRIYFKDADRRAVTHGFATNGKTIKGYSKKKPAPAGWSKKGTPMPYWSEFKSGYGFHTGWLKPYPCTAGCIRMHQNLAPKFFRIVQTGTPVNISTSQSLDATLGASVKRPPNADPFPGYAIQDKLNGKVFKYHKTPVYQ